MSIEIIHIMADGTVRDSPKGYEVPVNERTAQAYEILADRQQVGEEPPQSWGTQTI